MPRIPCKSAIPAWAMLSYGSEPLALEIYEIISGSATQHLLFDDDTELLWDDDSTLLLWN